MLKNILMSFVPIFVAVDAIGILPVFASLTEGFAKKERLSIVIQSVITASFVAVGFIFLGKAIFRYLGITAGDFMIAGGSVMFCLAIIDIANPLKKRRIPGKELGAVPIGTPLIAGPAVLTISLIIMPQYGVSATLISVLANIILAGIVFSFVDVLTRLLGEAGSKTLSKITSLLLAAISVMMIRKGLSEFIKL